jgi:hypothetical protein
MTLSHASRRFHRPLIAAVLSLAVVAAGCGSSSHSSTTSSGSGSSAPKSTATTAGPNPNAPEVSPSGDIPDNQAYVAYSPPGAKYAVKVPEGWSRSSSAQGTTFTDKLNFITMTTERASAAPTVQQVRQVEVPKLARTVKGFHAGTVSMVKRKGGQAIRVTYTATSQPNAVTGKSITEAVERYIFFHNGKNLVLTLSGPKGADNVDPWRIVTDSVRWSA